TAVAHTKQSYDTHGAFVVHADTALKGVSLGGGMVHIDAISSTSTARTDGRGIADHDEHLTISGVTAGGQPAAIDETGVHIGGQETPASATEGTPGTPASFDAGTPGTPGTPPSFTTGTGTRRPTVAGNRSQRGIVEQLEADLVGHFISHRIEYLYLAFTLLFI